MAKKERNYGVYYKILAEGVECIDAGCECCNMYSKCVPRCRLVIDIYNKKVKPLFMSIDYFIDLLPKEIEQLNEYIPQIEEIKNVKGCE